MTATTAPRTCPEPGTAGKLPSVTGLVLAGGRGSRMGGVEKGLQAFNGAPMLAEIVARLRPQVDELAINANRELDRYRAFGFPVRPDLRTGLPGPMAGIEAGLAACTTDLLVVVPCDSPCLPPDLVCRLHAAMERRSAALAYAVTDSGQGEQAHPVFCMLDRSLLPQLRAALDAGERRLGSWLRSQGAAPAVFSDEAAFRNINTFEELQGFQRT
ncbi:MAG TPA: molybdenum cofactor guanylyltransferase MobA [Noviherbaspirillum sp.]|nr:molybdenum cofactor guanylyltransferase MobA [Noviherbaspirillum sp.]